MSTSSRKTWQDYVEALGPPVYRACGQEPSLGFGAHGNPPVAVDLSFGGSGRLLAVETSLEPVDDCRMLMGVLMNIEPEYPLTINEENVTVAVDGNPTFFRMLSIDDDRWSAVATVGDRWVYLRGVGIPVDDVAIEQVGPA